MRRLISREVLRVAMRKSCELILRNPKRVLPEFVQVSANISQRKICGQRKKQTAGNMFRKTECISLTIVVENLVSWYNSMFMKEKNSLVAASRRREADSGFPFSRKLPVETTRKWNREKVEVLGDLEGPVMPFSCTTAKVGGALRAAISPAALGIAPGRQCRRLQSRQFKIRTSAFVLRHSNFVILR